MHEQALQRVTHPDAIAALRQGAKMFSARAADLEKLSDAAKPLYESLDDAQKRTLRLYCCARPRVIARSTLLPLCASFTDMDRGIPDLASSNVTNEPMARRALAIG